MFRPIIPVLLFLVSFPLFAKAIRIDPPAPTSETTITVLIAANNPAGCSFSLDRIRREGSSFSLQYKSGVCLFTPASWSDTVRLGLLDAGSYTVSLSIDGKIIDSYDFFVIDGSSALTFLPTSVQVGTVAAVRITSAPVLHLCDAAGCTKPVVTFGNTAVPAQGVTVVDAHTLVVLTVIPNVGPVTVTVTTPSETVTAQSAFRSRPRDIVPDREIFERILLPIVYNGFGFGGTWWRTDLAILNTNPISVGATTEWRPLFNFHPCQTEPPCPGYLLPGQSADAFDALTRSDTGSLLMPQRDLAAGLHFSYRAWEMFQVVQGLSSGTQLPIVREKDFRIGRVDLVQVPLDHHSRIALRIYGPDSEIIPVMVSVFKFDDPTTPVARKGLVLQAPSCSTDPCDATVPSFASISNLEQEFPALASLDRVRIQVDSASGFRFWALATITNNTTQQITLVTPQ